MTQCLFSSESVSEGGPDKIANNASVCILEAILEQNQTAYVTFDTLANNAKLRRLRGNIDSFNNFFF